MGDGATAFRGAERVTVVFRANTHPHLFALRCLCSRVFRGRPGGDDDRFAFQTGNL